MRVAALEHDAHRVGAENLSVIGPALRKADHRWQTHRRARSFPRSDYSSGRRGNRVSRYWRQSRLQGPHSPRNEGAGSLEALRLTFLRKGYFSRQERLLRELREAGCSTAAICALQIGDVTMQGDMIVIRPLGRAAIETGSAAVLQRYLQRRCELGLDCSSATPLIVDLEGTPFSADRLQAHYESIRTLRVALEANGSFCRALLSVQYRDAAGPLGQANTGGTHVPT